MAIKTLIVEDELASQQLLSTIIIDYCPTLHLVGVAENIDNALAFIEELNPDLIFLDIHIGNQTGFDLLDRINQKNFKIIITTAHDEYALKAFKYEAVDYILKPYSPKDVIKSVQRIVEKLEESKAFLKLEKVITENFQMKESGKISIPTSEGLKVFKLDNITRIEGSGAYSRIFSIDTKAHLISKSLKELEAILPSTQFFRVHDSHIINMKHVKEYIKEDGGMVILENDNQVPVSRKKKQEFLNQLK